MPVLLIWEIAYKFRGAILIGLAVIAVLAWHWSAVRTAREEGKQIVRQQIERDNAEAKSRADRQEARTVSVCEARGGNWDRRAGKCDR